MYLVVVGKVTEFETSSSIFVAGRLKKTESSPSWVNRVKNVKGLSQEKLYLKTPIGLFLYIAKSFSIEIMSIHRKSLSLFWILYFAGFNIINSLWKMSFSNY